jgi:UDP-GlcNAc:undecaprenyl-phosphate GlcNAc-1-phosphate transferase
VLLLLPRFTPRAPRWAEAFVPPRYRRGRASEADVPEAAGTAAEAGAQGVEGPREADAGDRTPVAAGVSGVNGASAVGPRARLADRSRPR